MYIAISFRVIVKGVVVLRFLVGSLSELGKFTMTDEFFI